ncbi:hypothetical protein [Luteimonas sp. TWI1437]|uniref:O-antigen ligase family protein n=1 Tax=unclassified Luteimonas TaxID=2629088 RepID=UPI00320AC7DC
MTLSFRSSLSLSIFLLLYAADAVLYSVRITYGWPTPPVGLFASALAIVAFFLFSRPRKQLILPAFCILGFMIAGLVAAAQSDRYDLAWLSNYYWYAAAFIAGAFFIANYRFDSGREGRRTFLISLAVIVAITYIYSSDRILLLQERLNYIRVAGGTYSLLLLAIVTSANTRSKALIYLLGLVAIYLIGSRSWFYLWLITPLVYQIAQNGLGFKSAIRIAVLFVALGSGLLYVVMNNYFNIIDSRIVRLLLSSDTDTSLNERSHLLQAGIRQIQESPLWGRYNGFLDYLDGGYIHNILSFWHQFGLIPFAIVVLMLALPIPKMLVGPAGGRSELFGRMVFISALIQSVLALSYVNHYLFFAFGVTYGLVGHTARHTSSDGKMVRKKSS